MDKLATQFAPAQRVSKETILAQKKLLGSVPFLQELYDAVNESIVILNKERQIVFANKSFLKFLMVKNPASIFGLRLGEAFGCINAFRLDGGCGTTEFCTVCGAINSILISQKKKTKEQETRILKGRSGEALDLLVKSTLFRLGGEEWTIFTIKDISHEKRRRALERIFFHDITNSITSLGLISESLRSNKTSDMGKIRNLITESIEDLTKSINGQKILTEAENNDLSVERIALSTRAIVENLLERYSSYAAKNRVALYVDPKGEDVSFKSDPKILLRVLENMVKNAIEASRPGNKVTLGVKKVKNEVHFWVNNKTVMPRETQLQLFQRSFSTKEAGRGLGTYSMKLLSERYLRGQITFTSVKGKGTTFTAIYPIKI